MYNSSIMIYAFKHSDTGMKCCNKYCLYNRDISCASMQYVVKQFVADDAAIEEVYAIDNSMLLKKAWNEVCKHNDVAGNYEFYNYVASSKESVKLK